MKPIGRLLIASLLSSLSVHGQESYAIDGLISGGAEGKTVYLLKGDMEQNRIAVDSTIIKDGKFQFKGKLAMPGPFAIKIYKTADRSYFTKDLEIIARPHVPLFLSNGSVHIEAVLDSMPVTALKTIAYDYNKVDVTGSNENAAYMEYIQKLTPLMKAKDALLADYKAYLTKRPNVSVSEGISLIQRIDAFDDTLKTFVIKFIKEHKDKQAAVYVFRKEIFSSNVGIFSPEEINELLTTFSAAVKTTRYYKTVSAEAHEIKKYAVGRRFTDLDLIDPGGRQVKLSDYIGKGKYVLLDFWGPWCIPCRKEFPFVKEAYELYHPQGFEIIGISVDNHKDRWPKAMKEENLPWKQLAYPKHPLVNETGVKLYAYWSIPFCVLISPDGTIVDRNMSGAYLDRKLIEIYGNKFSHR